MKGKQTENKTLLLSLGTILSIFLLFLVVHPSLSSHFLSFQRQNKLNQLIKTIKEKQTVPEQEYWKFREFYSLGHFTFREHGFSVGDNQSIIKKIAVPIPQPSRMTSFLFYESPHFMSLDSIVDTSTLSKLIDPANIHAQEIVIDTPNTKIYYTDQQTVKIIFIKPISAMKNANGFLDYSKINPTILEGKYWVNISSLSV
jgi:hypothetical protein